MLVKQVTRHEYEVETSNGKTITKRRKTKSTVMFEVCALAYIVKLVLALVGRVQSCVYFTEVEAPFIFLSGPKKK